MPIGFANYPDYLGIPFDDEDRGREGLHCYALARLIFLELHALDLGDYGPAKLRQENGLAIGAAKVSWPFIDVSNAPRQAFDLVVYAVGRIDDHIAMAVDERWMIHVQRGGSSQLDEIRDPRFGRISGVYRHEALA